MAAYVALHERESAREDDGYTATRHQREVGAGYFDEVSKVGPGGTASTLAPGTLHRGGPILTA